VRNESYIFSVIAFNINDNLNKKEVELKRVLQKQIDKHRNHPTLMTLAEAYRPGEVDDAFVYRFGRYIGQIATSTPYETSDNRRDDHVLVTSYDELLMAEPPQITRVRLATRNAIRMVINNSRLGNNLSFFGLHLDDRSEESRLDQVDALLSIIDPNDRTIVAGDFNSMNRETAAAQIALKLGELGARWRPESIDPNVETGKRTLVAKLYGVSEMAVGAPMRRLTDAGFEDSDNSYFPSSTINIVPGRLGPRIDHVLHSENAGVTVIDTATFPGPSDHRGTRVTYRAERLAA
jgi:endonuclease/exonuclease/phosphatase family metal-dependent hydrolase